LVTGQVLLEMETHLLASFNNQPLPWEIPPQVAVPEAVLKEAFWWYKGVLHCSIVSGAHMPKMDTFGLCDPLVKVTVLGTTRQTRHLRNTLSPVWNEAMKFDIPDGAHVAQQYFQMRRSNPEAAQRLSSVCLELVDWDFTGNENIGFATLELYALMDQIARPGAAGIEVEFPVLDSRAPGAAPVLGFDGEETSVTVRLRWELDAAAEAERVAAVEAAENEKRRQARAILLQQERELKAQIARELAEKQAIARKRFLQQLLLDSELGGDVYSCGAGAYGQHGHGHTVDQRSQPLLVEGAERGVIQHIEAGAAHSLFLQDDKGDGSRVLACGAGTFGQLGVIDCKPPKAGMPFDDALRNEAMMVREQLVPNDVLAVSDEGGHSFGTEVLFQDALDFSLPQRRTRFKGFKAVDSRDSSLVPDSELFLGPEEERDEDVQEEARSRLPLTVSRAISCPSTGGEWRAQVVQATISQNFFMSCSDMY
jgi:hypothetical protein